MISNVIENELDIKKWNSQVDYVLLTMYLLGADAPLRAPHYLQYHVTASADLLALVRM